LGAVAAREVTSRRIVARMTRTALILLLVVGCGGKKPEPAEPSTDSARLAEGATATEPEPPPEPAEPAAPAEPDESVVAQAALTEQYELGKQLYVDKKCATCHGDSGAGNKKNPAVIGDKAFPEKPAKTAKLRKGVTFTTAQDVMDFVKKHMPLKAPGTLTDDEAAAITAWMLSESKVAIDRKLDATNAASIDLR
jgi:S-disulfanyl-L-cysteine oxidoreductase SoxD